MANYRDRIPEFQRDIVANPLDQSIWLILADWLKEHNDPRGEMVQVQYELRNEPYAYGNKKQVERERRMLELHSKRIDGCLPRWNGIVGMPFVFIPPGVGCPKPFWMAACTVARFHTFRLNQTYDPTSEADFNPLTNVSFRQATQIWCRLFSDDKAFSPNGERFRLPTEVEWQYACRAGTTTAYWCGDRIESKFANCRYGRRGSQPELKPIMSLRPNPFGLYHVHGNVWEWCETLSRWTAEFGNIVMGGSYNEPPDRCKSDSYFHTDGDRHVGFRMAFDVVGS